MFHTQQSENQGKEKKTNSRPEAASIEAVKKITTAEVHFEVSHNFIGLQEQEGRQECWRRAQRLLSSISSPIRLQEPTFFNPFPNTLTP